MQELLMMADSDPRFLFFLRSNPHYVLGVHRGVVTFKDIYDEYKVATHQTFGDKMEQIGQVCSIAKMMF